MTATISPEDKESTSGSSLDTAETKGSRDEIVSMQVGGDEPERGNWGGRFDFLLACLGTAVGLGNVWRFPYLCYKNGGGAFLIPYIIMIFLVGLPVFMVELALGQYTALGPLKLFKNLAPLFKGMGYAMILAATMVAIYYNMIIAWTLFYFFDSFRSDSRWQYCHHEFNSANCFDDRRYSNCKSDNFSNVFLNNNCYNSSFAEMNNITDIAVDDRVSPPQEYFNKYVLKRSTGIENMGIIQWDLALCLLAAWIVVVGSLIKGIKTSGKVVYFTATFPYVILIILFIQGLTLDGATEGLKFYLIPDFSKLTDISVWEDAAIQVFYSFSIGGGSMITYASYNRFKNNVIKDAWIIGIGDMLTSIFSGLVVFSMLGFMAKQLGKPVPEVVESGTGLAFIAYPDGLSRTSVPILWALLFFFMLFLLGIDSQFAMVETIITFVFDQFPQTRNKKPIVVTAIGVILFLLGLPLTCNGGIYVLELIDAYAAGWPYLLIGLLECVIVVYVYGIKNFLNDLREMTGWSPGLWVRSHLIVVLATLAPVLIAVILLLSWINYESLTLKNYVFPQWSNAIGWTLAMIPVSCIIIGALHEIIFTHRKQGIRDRMKLWCKPTDVWRANAYQHKGSNEPTEVQVSSNKIQPFNHQMAYDNPAVLKSP